MGTTDLESPTSAKFSFSTKNFGCRRWWFTQNDKSRWWYKDPRRKAFLFLDRFLPLKISRKISMQNVWGSARAFRSRCFYLITSKVWTWSIQDLDVPLMHHSSSSNHGFLFASQYYVIRSIIAPKCSYLLTQRERSSGAQWIFGELFHKCSDGVTDRSYYLDTVW